jgi:hypothetical protein
MSDSKKVICPVCAGYGETETDRGWRKCNPCRGAGKLDPETAHVIRAGWEICETHNEQFCDVCRPAAMLPA